MSALHNLGVKLGLASDLPVAVVEQMKTGQERMETVLDADMKEVLHKMEGRAPKPIESLSPADARRQPNLASGVIAQMAKEGKKPETVLHWENVDIGDGVSVRVIVPADPSDPHIKYDAKRVPEQLYSLIVYAHGGGWVIASNNDYETGARTLANLTRSVVVMVEYRQAPEFPFPAAHLDVLSAYQWATTHAARWHADPNRSSLVGESAGGNMVVSTAVQTIVQGEAAFVRPRSVVAIYPVAQMTDFNSSSYHLNAHVKPLNRAMMLWFGQHYLRPMTSTTGMATATEGATLSEQHVATSHVSHGQVAQASQAAEQHTREQAMPKKAHASALVLQAMTVPASGDVQALPGMRSASDPHIDLLQVPAELLCQLPPVLILNAEVDPLLDDGLQLASTLRTAGTPAVEQITYSGVTHEFFGAGAVVAKACQANQRAADWINQYNNGTTVRSGIGATASTANISHAAAAPQVVATAHMTVAPVAAAVAMPVAVSAPLVGSAQQTSPTSSAVHFEAATSRSGGDATTGLADALGSNKHADVLTAGAHPFKQAAGLDQRRWELTSTDAGTCGL